MRAELLVAAALACLPAGAARAQKGVPPTAVVVGGHAMESDRDLVENLSQSADTRVFIELVRDAGLTEMLRQGGPFTVFVPSDEAFAKLAPGVLDGLRRPENKARLGALLSNHLIKGIYSSSRLRLLLRGAKGQADLETVAGNTLSVGTNGPSNLVLRNAAGIAADITLYDVKDANGVVFIIDRVVPPG